MAQNILNTQNHLLDFFFKKLNRRCQTIIFLLTMQNYFSKRPLSAHNSKNLPKTVEIFVEMPEHRIFNKQPERVFDGKVRYGSTPKDGLRGRDSSILPSLANNVRDAISIMSEMSKKAWEVGITLILLNNTKRNFKINKKSTVLQLKKFIFENVSPELRAQLFVLKFNDRILPSNTILQAIQSQNILLFQERADLIQTEGITVDYTKKAKGELGAAVMSCRHSITRKMMRQTISNILLDKNYQISCQIIDQKSGKKCGVIWKNTQWQLVGGFTQKQVHQINNRLSYNKISANAHFYAENKKESQKEEIFTKASKQEIQALNNKSVFLQKKKTQQETQNKIKINLELYDQRNPITIEVEKIMTIKELKQSITQLHTPELLPKQFNLTLNGTVLPSSQILAAINFGHNILKQQKCAIQTNRLKYMQLYFRESAPENGKRRMSCGHWFSINELAEIKESCLRKGVNDIRCPRIIQGIRCNTPFTVKELRGAEKIENKSMELFSSKLVDLEIHGNNSEILDQKWNVPLSNSRVWQSKVIKPSQKKIYLDESLPYQVKIEVKQNNPNIKIKWQKGRVQVRLPPPPTQQKIRTFIAIEQDVFDSKSDEELVDIPPKVVPKSDLEVELQQLQDLLKDLNIQLNNLTQYHQEEQLIHLQGRERMIEIEVEEKRLEMERQIALVEQQERKKYEEIKKNQVEVNIQFYTKTTACLKEINKKITVQELKKIVDQKHPHDFLPTQTVYLYKEEALSLNAILAQVTENSIIPLTERKAEVWELPSIEGSQEEDPVTCVKGTATMSCTHKFSREGMRECINAHLASNLYSIKCGMPNVNNEKCNYEWSHEEWRLVAGFSKTQMKDIQTRLSLNYFKHSTLECKYCGVMSSISGVKQMRVKCPNCLGPDFCRICREPWKWPGTKICQSGQCLLLKNFIVNAQMTRQFIVYQNGKKITVKTPEYRACPRCRMVITNTVGCKHTKCPCVGMKDCFCFICLALIKDGRWPCGGYNDYCGFVAEKQIYS